MQRVQMVLLSATSLAVMLCSPSASAHMRLLKPASWLVEDDAGNPQKSGPCGSASGSPTGAVTQYHAGDTITVQWFETVPHPGYFRIALVRDRSELQDPPMQIDSSCNFAPGSVPMTAAPVLADNLFPRSSEPAPRMFETQVTLPDMTCDHCTLQVIQFMSNHPPPCIYYHCADVALLPAGAALAPGSGATGGASAGQGGVAAAGQAGSVAPAGAPAATAPGSSGCSVIQHRQISPRAALSLCGAGLALAAARSRRTRRCRSSFSAVRSSSY